VGRRVSHFLVFLESRTKMFAARSGMQSPSSLSTIDDTPNNPELENPKSSDGSELAVSQNRFRRITERLAGRGVDQVDRALLRCVPRELVQPVPRVVPRVLPGHGLGAREETRQHTTREARAHETRCGVGSGCFEATRGGTRAVRTAALGRGVFEAGLRAKRARGERCGEPRVGRRESRSAGLVLGRRDEPSRDTRDSL
jgi:hypothetical protein